MTPLNGWITVPRSVLAAEWYVQADSFTRALWLHLMLTVNFATTTTRSGLVLKPGQTVTSWRALADALVCREQGRIVTPHVSKVRRAAALLEKAGEATVQPTGRPTYTGIVVTLERWAFYAGEAAQATDPETDAATDRLSGARQHRNNTTGLSAQKPEQPMTREQLRREMEAFTERCRRDAQELAEIRAREAGEGVH